MAESRMWAGVAFILLAAVTLAGTSVSAVLSFGGGANPSAVMIIRFIGAIIVLYGLLRYARAPIRLPPRERAVALALGLAQAAQSYFLYTSLDHIPVGLTLIIFYIYPLLVGLIASAIGQDRLTWKLAGGLVVAFSGLILVFNVTGEGLGLIGAAFAVFAAISWSLVVVGTTSLTRGGDSRPVTFHVQLSALIFVTVFLIFTGDVRLPGTPQAWAGYLLIPVLYSVGVTSFFIATSIIGSVRSSLIMNFEPVAAIVLAYLILGQTLTPLQLLGGVIVISALLAVKWDARSKLERS